MGYAGTCHFTFARKEPTGGLVVCEKCETHPEAPFHETGGLADPRRMPCCRKATDMDRDLNARKPAEHAAPQLNHAIMLHVDHGLRNLEGAGDSVC